MDTHSAVPSPVTGGKAPLSWRAPGRREKERERMVTEKANYHKYALNRRRPSPDRLKIKGKMKTQSRFTEDSAEWFDGFGTARMCFRLAKAPQPAPTNAPGSPEGQTGNSGWRQHQDQHPQFQKAGRATSPQNCHRSLQTDPGVPSAASCVVGRASPHFFLVKIFLPKSGRMTLASHSLGRL